MNVTVFSTNTCPYCVKAKTWLSENDISYDEIVLDNQDAIIRFKESCPGKTTVPQIIVNDELIGGCDDLMEKQEYVFGILKG